MISTRFLTHRLESGYIGCSRIAPPDYLPSMMEILDDQSAISKNILYLCTMRALKERAFPECENGTAVFVCECEDDIDLSIFPKECAAFLFKCSLSRVQNEILRTVNIESSYLNRLQMLIASGGNAHQFIQELAKTVSGDSILLDENFSVIFTSEMHLKGMLQTSLTSTGQIPEETVKKLLFSPDRYKGNVGVSAFREYGTTVFSVRAVSSEGLSVTLLLERSSALGMDTYGLMNNVHRILERWLFSGGYAAATKIYTSFQKCWDRIRSGESDNDTELRDVFTGLPHPITGDIRIGVIRFNTPRNVPYNYILAMLRNIDSDMNVAINNSDIVLVIPERLLGGSGRSEKLEKNRALLKLLDDFDAYMIYGNYTGRPKHITEVFFLSRRVLIIASKLDPEKRVFFYEDYASYGAIDLAAQNYLTSAARPNAYMLVNPSIISLAIHDKEHGDDLRDVLFHYLVCERNVKKTADTMHMHRNTVLNKLKRISELVSVDLEDYQLRQRLLFSCQFIRYYEKILEMPLPVKGAQD